MTPVNLGSGLAGDPLYGGRRLVGGRRVGTVSDAEFAQIDGLVRGEVRFRALYLHQHLHYHFTWRQSGLVLR